MKTIGEYGPIILILTNIWLLFGKQHFLFYYVIFILISILINLFLKQLIKQPRPSIDLNTFNMTLKNNERFIKRDGVPYDIFGMPSGHTQSVIYSTIYNYLVFRNMKMTFWFVLISFITMFQRVAYNHHTVSQIVVGFIVGALLAYVAYYFPEKKLSSIVKANHNYNNYKFI
jgi:hypothetical protein